MSTDREWEEMDKRLDEIERADPLYQHLLTVCIEEVIDDIKGNRGQPVPKDIRGWLQSLTEETE